MTPGKRSSVTAAVITSITPFNLHETSNIPSLDIDKDQRSIYNRRTDALGTLRHDYNQLGAYDNGLIFTYSLLTHQH